VTIAAHFGGATGGVTLDNKQLSLRRITLGAVSEFAGKAAAAMASLRMASRARRAASRLFAAMMMFLMTSSAVSGFSSK
jgi:hypothetical protein